MIGRLTGVCSVVDGTTDIVYRKGSTGGDRAQGSTKKFVHCRDARGACDCRWKMKDRNLAPDGRSPLRS